MTQPMRILHTADWHLNDRLGRVDRQPDILDRLRQIASYLESREVDVMLTAGDLFSKFSRSDALRDALSAVDEIFRPFLLRGGTIVATSGNHDHEATFNMLHTALNLASPIDPTSTGPRPRGRLYLAARATKLLLEGHGGQRVQFVLLPWPAPARYLTDLGTRYSSFEERNRLLHQALAAQLERIRREHLDPSLPSVLAAHLHVRGSEVHSLYHITEAEDVVFEQGDLPTSWAYVALGHIHKPQALPGMPHVRYSGSVERLDFAEREDAKGCVLVEIDATGLIGTPEVLPLDATPIHELIVTDPATQLVGLAERFPDHEHALLRYELHWTPGEHNRDAICRQIESIFPRWYQRDVRMIGGGTNADGSRSFHGTIRDVCGTTRAWLENRIPVDDPDRDDLLALAATYMDQLEEAQ